MRLLLDSCYVLIGAATAPIWLTRMIVTGKIRTDWPGRFGRVDLPPSPDGRPRILIHAVSVGEVNATRILIDMLLRDQSRPEVVLSVTTDTGYARGVSLFGGRCAVVRYPLDFSFAVRPFLDEIRPDVVALVELEVWPNFTAECAHQGIPIGVINGRLSARSFRRYTRIRTLVRRSFSRLAFACVQTETYAERFRALGTHRDRVRVTDTMKWDTAVITDHVDGADVFAEEMGISDDLPLVVAGSTAPEEHAMLHAAVPENVQLLCAPRKPEWFDRAAADLPGCARRSKGDCGSQTHRFLLDTIGELGRAYALADVVIIGRTFATYGGSDMMEPVALGKPTIVGPDVRNFEDTARALLDRDGIVQTDVDHLPQAVRSLLQDAERRSRLITNGRAVIRERQGASARHAAVILEYLEQGGADRDAKPDQPYASETSGGLSA